MGKPNYEMKVLLKRGSDRRQLLWLGHYGTDIFCTVVASDTKTSYHASGERHVKDNSRRTNPLTLRWKEKTSRLQGLELLQSLSFRNEECWHGEDSPFKKYKDKGRGEGILLLDGDAMTEGAAYAIQLGVAGTSAIEAMAEFERLHLIYGKWAIREKLLFQGIFPGIFGYLLQQNDAPNSSSADQIKTAGEQLSMIGLNAIPEPGFAISGDIGRGGLMTIHFVRGRLGEPPKRPNARGMRLSMETPLDIPLNVPKWS